MRRLIIGFSKNNTPFNYWRATKTLITGEWYMIDYKVYECLETDLVRKTFEELMEHIYNQYTIKDRDRKINKILKW